MQDTSMLDTLQYNFNMLGLKCFTSTGAQLFDFMTDKEMVRLSPYVPLGRG